MVRVWVVFNFLALCACSLFILATDITGSPWDICNGMGSAFKEYMHDDLSLKTNIFVVDYPGNQPLCVFAGKPPKCAEKDLCDVRIYVASKESSVPLLLDFRDERNLSYKFPTKISRTFDIEGNYMFGILLESNPFSIADRAIASVSPERLSQELKTHRGPTNDPIQLKMECDQWKNVDTYLRVFAYEAVPMGAYIKAYAATKKDISVKFGDYEKTLVEIPKGDNTLILAMWLCSEGLCYNTTKRKNLHIQFICHKIISKEECWVALSCEWKNQACLNKTNLVTKKQEYPTTHAQTLIDTKQDHTTKSPELADVSGNLPREPFKIEFPKYLEAMLTTLIVLFCILALCCIGGATYLVVQWCKKKSKKVNLFTWLKRNNYDVSSHQRGNDEAIPLYKRPDQDSTRGNTAYSETFVDYMQKYELNRPKTDTNQQTITSIRTVQMEFDVEHPRHVDEIIGEAEIEKNVAPVHL